MSACLIVPVAVMVMAAFMTMMLLMAIGVTAGGVGTAFRIKRGFDLNDARTESANHILNDVIAPYSQPFSDNLRGKMTIAEMPRNADQMLRITPADLEKLFGRAYDLDPPSVFQDERVAATKRYGFFQIEQEFQPTRRGYGHTAPVTVIKPEHNRIGRRTGPSRLSQHISCADQCGRHVASIST